MKELTDLAGEQMPLLIFPGMIEFNPIGVAIVKDDFAIPVGDYLLDMRCRVGVFDHPELLYQVRKF
jgi:hypothetical protein